MIACKLLITEKKIVTNQELRYLMVGGKATSVPLDNPSPEWLSDK